MIKKFSGLFILCLFAFLPITQAKACDCPMMHHGAQQSAAPCPMHSKSMSHSAHNTLSSSTKSCGCGMIDCHCAGHCQMHSASVALFSPSTAQFFLTTQVLNTEQHIAFNSIIITQDNPPPRSSLA